MQTIALLCILGRGNKVGPARHQWCCCVVPKIERDSGAMRILGLVTLRLVSFFRRRRFDLCNQVSISIHLDCMSSALHSFSGIIKLADHLACMAVAMSTADNKFTAESIYAMENRHHAHSCSGLDFACLFLLLGGCSCICYASTVWSGVWHQPLSVQCSLWRWCVFRCAASFIHVQQCLVDP